MFEKRRLQRNVNGINVEFEELDIFEKCEFESRYSDFSVIQKKYQDIRMEEIEKGENKGKLKVRDVPEEQKEELAEIRKKHIELFVKIFEVPKLFVNGEKVENLSLFLGRIGVVSGIAFYYEIMTAGGLEDEEGK